MRSIASLSRSASGIPASIWLNQVGKTLLVVIPNEVRNRSAVLAKRKRDSSARSAPRNDNVSDNAASCERGRYMDREILRDS